MCGCRRTTDLAVPFLPNLWFSSSSKYKASPRVVLPRSCLGGARSPLGQPRRWRALARSIAGRSLAACRRAHRGNGRTARGKAPCLSRAGGCDPRATLADRLLVPGLCPARAWRFLQRNQATRPRREAVCYFRAWLPRVLLRLDASPLLSLLRLPCFDRRRRPILCVDLGGMSENRIREPLAPGT